jgi:hypothetical protein
MFAALVLAGIIAAPLGTAALLVQARHRFAATGTGPAIRRFAFAIGGTAVLAVIVIAVLRLLRVTEHNSIDAVAGLAAASLIWLPVTRRWNARAHLCWSSSIFLFVVYLAFVLDWTFASHLGVAGTAGGLLLWLFEVFAAFLACAYLWEICDALGSEQWRRRITPAAPAGQAGGRRASVYQPARARSQRAARHGHRDAAVTAATRLPPVRGHRDRRQHR